MEKYTPIPNQNASRMQAEGTKQITWYRIIWKKRTGLKPLLGVETKH
jgi:hypothetical protein